MNQVIKAGCAVSIRTQEELNLLSELTGFETDSIVVEGEMFAFYDEQGAVCVAPIDEYREGDFVYFYKKFKSWYRSLK